MRMSRWTSTSRDAILHAHEMSIVSKGTFGAGQTVKLKDLKSREDLNGKLAILLRPSKSKKSRWMVRLSDGSGVNLAEKNMINVKGRNGRVMIFWGHISWFRAQLLGQIAKGQWGITKAVAGDIIAKSKKRIQNLRPRMIVPPTHDGKDDPQRRRRKLSQVEQRQLMLLFYYSYIISPPLDYYKGVSRASYEQLPYPAFQNIKNRKQI